jgi:hypothetical protein
MARRLRGNGVSVDKDGFIHIEVNGCRIVMPPASAREVHDAKPKGRAKQTRLKFPKAVEATAH